MNDEEKKDGLDIYRGRIAQLMGLREKQTVTVEQTKNLISAIAENYIKTFGPTLYELGVNPQEFFKINFDKFSDWVLDNVKQYYEILGIIAVDNSEEEEE